MNTVTFTIEKFGEKGLDFLEYHDLCVKYHIDNNKDIVEYDDRMRITVKSEYADEDLFNLIMCRSL